jgi:hypothetical protein
MKITSYVTLLLAGALYVEALRIPNVFDERENIDFSAKRDVSLNNLFKRKGGGGGGKGGSSSGSK